jgi:hypothetical protein
MRAIPVSMGTHHTVGYEDTVRFSNQIKKLHAMFFGAVLRRNITNFRGIMWLLISKERGITFGGLLIGAGIAGISLFGAAGSAAFGAFVLTDLIIGIARGSDPLYRLYLHYLFPMLTVAGCLHTPDRRRPFVVEVVPP